MGKVSKNMQTKSKLTTKDVLVLLSKITNRRNSISPSRLRRCTSEGYFYSIIDTCIIDSKRYFKIKFDSGFTKTVPLSMINDGKIKDYLSPSVCGIGYLGTEFKNIFNADYQLAHKLRSRWKNMLGRCYNKNNKKYNIYGGAGVSVDPRWHNFSNYFYDVILLDGFDREKVINNELFLDKDKFQQNTLKKVYSKTTCCWLSIFEQNKLVDPRNRIASIKHNLSSYFEVIYPDGNKRIERGIKQFSNDKKLSYNKIQKILYENNQHEYNGYIFRNVTQSEIDNCSV